MSMWNPFIKDEKLYNLQTKDLCKQVKMAI